MRYPLLLVGIMSVRVSLRVFAFDTIGLIDSNC